MMMKTLAAGLAAAFLAIAPASAEKFPAPKGEVILTVSGDISPEFKDKEVEFDRDMLEKMEKVVIETKTPWFEGVTKFEGVRLDKLMDAVGAKGTKLAAVALNDYASELPIEDLAKYGVILAYKRDGAYMQIKDKGPLFVVYPYDKDPELRSQKFYARSVWQVKELVVK